ELVLQSGVRSPQSKLSNPQSPFRFGLDVPLARQLAAEAEAYFFKAIAIARRQSAKSLELRAVMSLARLWQRQGKREESHKLLAELYSRFTEGFDTVDLKEAKALLEELRR